MGSRALVIKKRQRHKMFSELINCSDNNFANNFAYRPSYKPEGGGSPVISINPSCLQGKDVFETWVVQLNRIEAKDLVQL